MQKGQIESMVEAIIDEVTSPKMTLEIATTLMKKIEEEATRRGMKVVTAVSDAAARPVAVHCMDGAYIASYDVAFNKAYTVVALKMPTSKLKQLSQPGQPLYGIQFTNQGKIVIFGGGVPLMYNGKIIGGLGVSGGSEEQDTSLADYGQKILREVLTWQ